VTPRRALLGLAVICLLASVGRGHGGLPVSQQLFFDGNQITMAARYWGIFVGEEGGRWEWVCDEAISPELTVNPSRVWAKSAAGVYHLTDYHGVISSRDQGCTWTPATGEIATRPTAAVAADPVLPGTAWAVTYSSQAPWNAVWKTSDDGATWTDAVQADVYFNSLALSADGQTIYAGGVERGAGGRPVIYLSQNGGGTWTSVAPTYTLDGATPTLLRVLAVDPTDASVVYLAAFKDPTRALVKATAHAGVLTELVKSPGDLLGMAFDGPRNTVWVAGQTGLLRSVAGAPFQPAGGLVQAQCVYVRGATIYACSTNYGPEYNVIARSDDGGETFHSVYQYADTDGPRTSCPAGTPVATMCPGTWELYAERLGVPVAGRDGGADGMTAPPSGGCGGCSFGGACRG
jgi:hypothetical protein